MNIKLFNKWETEGIKIIDKGLERYINLKQLFVPRTGGIHVKTQFHKSKYNIVERLMNKLMVPGHTKKHKHKRTSGHCTGKASHVYKVVGEAFTIIEKKTNKNPVEVLIRAIENAAPREEINTIEYGGAKYPQAVECSPQRRIDLALRQMVWGTYAKSFKSRKSLAECLANEIILAYNLDMKSHAISKKLELERQADASR
jgi:small subunit ribosomal protein S7